MDQFEIKILCAAVLWIISMISGVLLPCFLWKISPKDRRRSAVLQEDQVDGTEESHSDESDKLIVGSRFESSRQTGGCLRCAKRAAAYFRTKCARGGFSSMIYCLCGGVFLGVSLLDLIPQSISDVQAALTDGQIHTQYPLAEFTITVGFLVVMTLENLVTECVMSEHGHRHHDAHRRSSSDTRESAESSDDSAESRAAHRDYGDSNNVSSFRMYILIVTLSFHSVFEGLAIGLQKDFTSLLQLVIAVSVHKAVLTFGVGITLFETFGRVAKVKTASVCAVIFCSASPLGCLAGAFVSGDSFQTSFCSLSATAILQCLATGTFLYVTFVEVLPREFSHHHSKDHCEQHGAADRNVCSRDRRQQAQQFKISSSGKQSKPLKLLAVIVGFSIASALQFL